MLHMWGAHRECGHLCPPRVPPMLSQLLWQVDGGRPFAVPLENWTGMV